MEEGCEPTGSVTESNRLRERIARITTALLKTEKLLLGKTKPSLRWKCLDSA